MISFIANFHFYGALTHFLRSGKESMQVAYKFTGTPSIKDAIETIGIPHVEVDSIFINRVPVDFTCLLKDNDLVEVYPSQGRSEARAILPLIEPYAGKPAFVLDVHLGKLARLLRMLGFDTLYETDYSDRQIAEIAAFQSRIVLTRDIQLLKRKFIKWGYWLRSQHPEKQLSEVVHYYNLVDYFQPFSRCLACNSYISPVEKDQIADLLPLQTKTCFNEFYQCSGCSRVYWKGSHYESMEMFIKKINFH